MNRTGSGQKWYKSLYNKKETETKDLVDALLNNTSLEDDIIDDIVLELNKRCKVNPQQISIQDLNKLSEHNDPFVKIMVATNPNCPIDTLEKIVKEISLLNGTDPDIDDDIVSDLKVYFEEKKKNNNTQSNWFENALNKVKNLF